MDITARIVTSSLPPVVTRSGDILPTPAFQPYEILLLGNPSAPASCSGECVGHSVEAEPHCKDVDPVFYE